jgi:hypothetical protein
MNHVSTYQHNFTRISGLFQEGKSMALVCGASNRSDGAQRSWRSNISHIVHAFEAACISHDATLFQVEGVYGEDNL